ncbi:uncharacterized protein ISCGN_005583 [Ixodes scapularis]
MIPGFWNIFAFIRTLYGSAALGNLREYFNQSTKIVRLECHQRFNRECLNHNVIPHGLRCRPRVDTPYGRKLAQNFSRACLKARMLDNKQKLIDCRHRLVTAEKFLRRTLQPDDMHHVFGARKQAEEMERVKRTDTHDKKLSQLIPKVPTPPASAVYNLSSKELSAGHSTKIVRLECHQRFNRECLNHNVIPHGLRCRPRVDTPYGRKLAQNFSRACLKARMLDNKQKLIDCRHRLVTAEKFLRRTLQPDDMHHVFGARKQAEEMERVKRTDTDDKKLSQLIPKVPTPPASAVYNLSSKELSAGHSTKIVRLECHQRFNRECLNHNVIPHGLRCRPRVDTPYGRKLAQNFSRACLKARMLDNKQKLIDCRHRLVTAEKFLRRTLQPDDMHHVFGARKQAEEMERVKRTDTHDKKLSQLIPKVPTPPASAVYNLSSKELSAGHSTKIVRLECHQRFNRECLNHNVIPHGLRCRPRVDTPYGRKLAQNFSRDCLKARMLDNKQKLIDCRHRLVTAEKFLRRTLQPDDMHHVFGARKQAEEMERVKRTDTHDKKLSQLIPKVPTPPASAVYNLSSKELSAGHVSVVLDVVLKAVLEVFLEVALNAVLEVVREVVIEVVLEVVLQVVQDVGLEVVLHVVREVVLEVVLEVILEVVRDVVREVVLEVVFEAVPEVVLEAVLDVVFEIVLEVILEVVLSVFTEVVLGVVLEVV